MLKETQSLVPLLVIKVSTSISFFLPPSLTFSLPSPSKLLAWVLGHLEIHQEHLGLLEETGVLECFVSMCISVEKTHLMFWQLLKGIPATNVS